MKKNKKFNSSGEVFITSSLPKSPGKNYSKKLFYRTTKSNSFDSAGTGSDTSNDDKNGKRIRYHKLATPEATLRGKGVHNNDETMLLLQDDNETLSQVNDENIALVKMSVA